MSKKIKLVTIGGGTGSFALLSGLKNYSDLIEINAIVSMADNGGSTGKLRDELGVLPPGDIRQCLVALSRTTDVMRDLMNYRFEKGSLKGHNFGNILLSALEKVSIGFTNGVEQVSKILNVVGNVIPVTTENVQLIMELSDGSLVKGEDAIGNTYVQHTGIESFKYTSKVKANPAAIKAINNADIIVVGPGDHYTSILPNLIIPGIKNALKKTKAKIIYIPNLTNKKGHTYGWTALDYTKDINKYVGKDFINCILFNTKKPSRVILRKYEELYGENTLVHLGHKYNNAKLKIIKNNYLNTTKQNISKTDPLFFSCSFIRHDGNKLAKDILKKTL